MKHWTKITKIRMNRPAFEPSEQRSVSVHTKQKVTHFPLPPHHILLLLVFLWNSCRCASAVMGCCGAQLEKRPETRSPCEPIPSCRVCFRCDFFPGPSLLSHIHTGGESGAGASLDISLFIVLTCWCSHSAPSAAHPQAECLFFW